MYHHHLVVVDYRDGSVDVRGSLGDTCWTALNEKRDKIRMYGLGCGMMGFVRWEDRRWISRMMQEDGRAGGVH